MSNDFVDLNDPTDDFPMWPQLVLTSTFCGLVYSQEEHDRMTGSESWDNMYDRLIYDGARDLAADAGRDVAKLRAALVAMGMTDELLLEDVALSQQEDDATDEWSGGYQEENYRGKMVDIGVIEAVKDCLRVIHRDVLAAAKNGE